MQHFLFVLKTILYTTLLGLIAGAVVGFLPIHEEHPHQIFPTYLISMVVCSLFSAVAGLLVGVVMLLLKNDNLRMAVVAAFLLAIFALLLATWLLIKS
jgi:hypothetical protein